ncbi:MAG: hypothetical protein R3F61_03440 [Myxococcota bacterium]
MRNALWLGLLSLVACADEPVVDDLSASDELEADEPLRDIGCGATAPQLELVDVLPVEEQGVPMLAFDYHLSDPDGDLHRYRINLHFDRDLDGTVDPLTAEEVDHVTDLTDYVDACTQLGGSPSPSRWATAQLPPGETLDIRIQAFDAAQNPSEAYVVTVETPPAN